jgi:hypothetical protein
MGGHSVSSWSTNWVTERPELLIDKVAQLTLVRGSMWALARSSTGHVGGSQASKHRPSLPAQERHVHLQLPNLDFSDRLSRGRVAASASRRITTRARPNLNRPTFEHSLLIIS